MTTVSTPYRLLLLAALTLGAVHASAQTAAPGPGASPSLPAIHEAEFNPLNNLDTPMSLFKVKPTGWIASNGSRLATRCNS